MVLVSPAPTNWRSLASRASMWRKLRASWWGAEPGADVSFAQMAVGQEGITRRVTVSLQPLTCGGNGFCRGAGMIAEFLLGAGAGIVMASATHRDCRGVD